MHVLWLVGLSLVFSSKGWQHGFGVVLLSLLLQGAVVDGQQVVVVGERATRAADVMTSSAGAHAFLLLCTHTS